MFIIYLIILVIVIQQANYYHFDMRKILKSKDYHVSLLSFFYNDYFIFKKMIREENSINEINNYFKLSKKYIIWSLIFIILVILAPFIWYNLDTFKLLNAIFHFKKNT